MMRLAEKEKKALQELKGILAKKYKLVEFKIFGSKARGESEIESDVDVFIVLSRVTWKTEKAIYELCFEIGLKYDVLLSPVLFSRSEIHSSLTRITPFYKLVTRQGVTI